jgi:alpha-tubulin suppressor-like RCC1 family protein
VRTQCLRDVRLALLAGLASLQLVGIACSDATAPVTPAQYIVTVSRSTAVAGDTLVAKAQLADLNGGTVARSGRVVGWFSTDGNGQFTGPQTLTDADGIATNLFVVGTKANITEKIVVSDQDRLQGDSPLIDILPAQPSVYAITVSAGLAAMGTNVLVTAQLTDKFGNATPVSGRVVTWSIADNSSSGYYNQIGVRANHLTAPSHAARTEAGTFAAPTSTTDGKGVASVEFNVGTAVNSTYIVAAHDGGGAVGNSPPITVGPGPIAKLDVAASVVDPPAGATVTITVTTSDAFGNRVTTSGTPIHWSTTGGTLSSATSVTDGSGFASTGLQTDASVGASYTVTASSIETTATGNSATITTVQQVSLASMAAGFGIDASCGIATDAKLWCWGAEGLLPARAVPGKPIGDQTVTAVSTNSFTCAIAGGTVECWGPNDVGQLGDNSHTGRSAPAPINSSLSFTAVTTGSTHACALATTHDIYCWGESADGRLGDGTGFTGLGPVKVGGGVSFIAVSAGRAHTCAIATSGDVYCWGANEAGQLGNGSQASSSTLTLVTGGLKFTAISAGDSHTCGLTANGAYCWGNNSFGQLGAGLSADHQSGPVAVKNSSTFTRIAAGGFHGCAIAANGQAFCWGDNTTGELGDPSFVANHSSIPVAVAGGFTFASIAVGGGGYAGDYYYGPSAAGHTCAVTTDGVAYCWGQNSMGALGISNFDIGSSATPLKVDGQH